MAADLCRSCAAARQAMAFAVPTVAQNVARSANVPLRTCGRDRSAAPPLLRRRPRLMAATAITMKANGSRSAARSKQDSRVRTRKSGGGAGAGGNGAGGGSPAGSSSAGGNHAGLNGRVAKNAPVAADDAVERELISGARVGEVLEECSRLIFFNHVVDDPVVEALLRVLEAVERLDGRSSSACSGAATAADEDDDGDDEFYVEFDDDEEYGEDDDAADDDDDDDDAISLSSSASNSPQRQLQLASVSEAYRDYFCALAECGTSWEDKFMSLVLYAENVFSRSAQQRGGADIPRALVNAAKYDLAVLQRLYECNPERVGHLVSTRVPQHGIPLWSVSEKERECLWRSLEEAEKVMRRTLASASAWTELMQPLQHMYATRGSGAFAEHRFFLWDVDAQSCKPAEDPDNVLVEELVGNRRAKRALRQNFEFLLSDLSAQNVLLCGSRGSGKSSLVKAFVNQFAARGLRLIEVDSASLEPESLRHIFADCRSRSHKFVLFLDDFNFDLDEEEYRVMRKVLDGGATRVPRNMIVCATTSRYLNLGTDTQARGGTSAAPGGGGGSGGGGGGGGGGSGHHGEHEMGDLYMEEDALGFSDRFGLIVTLEECNKGRYLDMVKQLATRAGIHDISHDILELRALNYVKSRSGYNGRTARHFINFLASEQTLLRREMMDCRKDINRIDEFDGGEARAECTTEKPAGNAAPSEPAADGVVSSESGGAAADDDDGGAAGTEDTASSSSG